jgi:hypothetical protein
MLKVWFVCILLYTVLPFYLVEKHLTLQGFLVLFLFLGAFCLGTLTVKPSRRIPAEPPKLDFSHTENLLIAASVIAIVSLLLDMQDKSVFDLAVSYELRSDQAAALMQGTESSSSMWFQIGFLTYPAGYAYLVRAIVFERRPSLTKLAAFGLLPVLMGTVVMGGRAPLLYAMVISLFAWSTRAIFMRRRYPDSNRRRLGLSSKLMLGVLVIGALYYFVAVFFTRAESVGGATGMFRVAESIWGIGFRGPMADLMFSVLGDEVTYVIFVFNWYVVQGLPMSNILFSDYDGPMQLGVYGVDLISALVRRLDGAKVARDFDALQQLGTYGFLPSAFGSLYVDLWFFGGVVSGIWGALAALVYQRIRSARDSRWLVLAPVVSMGILFSLINTPLGFSNGLITHLWMVLAFVSARQLKSPRPNPALVRCAT